MLKIFDIMENLNYKKEVWRDIPNYEGIYQVSNLGRVKSLERFDALGHKRKEKILKPRITRVGYYLVALTKQLIRKDYLVHRLVYEAFNGQMPEGYEVNHINEIKSDNRLSNLNLMTHKENINYGSRTEKCSKPVLQFDLQDILIKEYSSTHQAERETGFAQGNIVNCCNGKLKQAYGYIWRYKE